MKKFLCYILFLSLTVVVDAQVIGSGYYRVMNQRTSRYAYIEDCEADINASSIDISAVELWKGDAKNRFVDPASVIYFDEKKVEGNRHDGNLQAQGTGVYELTRHSVSVYEYGTASHYYQLYATKDGATVYLGDDEKDTKVDQGIMGTNATSTYRNWIVTPINTEDNYIAVAPSVSADGKFYASYYASYPYEFYSNGMKAYYVSKVDNQHAIAVIKEISGSVPSATPVIVECSSSSYENNKLKLLVDKNEGVSDNKLKGVYFCNGNRAFSKTAKVLYDAKTMRVLGKTKDGKLGFIVATDDMLEYVFDEAYEYFDYVACLKANQSYLPVEEGSPSEYTLMSEEEYNKVYGPKNYTLTYILDGVEYKSLNILEGSNVSAEAIPEKTGYTFSGWKNEPTVMPSHDVVVNGSFTVNSYKVSYYYGTSLVHDEMVKYGDVIPEYTYDPQDGRYSVEMWMSDESYDSMPAHDVVYNAVIADDIETVLSTAGEVHEVYSSSGIRMNRVQGKGLKIVRLKDGRTIKVFVK